jgi:protein-S-isoprenylcysteine O-methyltransferase Ste14
VKKIARFGRYLFKYRAAIAAVFFILLGFLAQPLSSTIAHISVIIGIGIRLWAAGYIGPEARKQEFSAEFRIVNGPFRIIKHPLYVGNFFLVLGVTILYNPPRYLGILYIILYITMYALIVVSESEYLKGKPGVISSYKFSNLKGEVSTLLVLAVIYALWFVLARCTLPGFSQ